MLSSCYHHDLNVKAAKTTSSQKVVRSDDITLYDNQAQEFPKYYDVTLHTTIDTVSTVNSRNAM